MLRQLAPLLLIMLAAPAAYAQVAPAADAQQPAPAATTPAATSPTAEQPAAPKPAVVRVRLETSLGPITLELEKERAPITTTNFLRYLDQKRFDGTSFYRATKIGTEYGLVQGGLRNDPKRLYPPIAHEPTTITGLTHGDGTISMARGAPGTATADFFITIGALMTLNADPAQPGDNLGFAAFGRVVEGMDIIRQILEAPTSPTEGEGVMRGQMLAPQIKIVSARRAD